jgi:hypothetical protein
MECWRVRQHMSTAHQPYDFGTKLISAVLARGHSLQPRIPNPISYTSPTSAPDAHHMPLLRPNPGSFCAMDQSMDRQDDLSNK